MKRLAAAIVPAAGRGTRLGLRSKKPFVLIKGKPIIAHTLERLNRSPVIDAIVVAAEKECLGRLRSIIKVFSLDKVSAIVAGGSTRFESVRNCLAEIGPEYDTVIIHDGARPFVADSIISEAVRAARKHGACAVCVLENDTVKLAPSGSVVLRTLDRKEIYRAQTPQAFRREILMDAYKRGQTSAHPTDDSELVEKAGYRVRIIAGSYANIKITTREDLELAKVLL